MSQLSIPKISENAPRKVDMPLALVFESRFEGHTLGYAQDIARQALQAQYEVICGLNTQAKSRPECIQINENAFDYYWCDLPETSYKSAAGGLADLQKLSEMNSKLTPDRIVVPSADSIVMAIATCAESRAIAASLPPMDLICHWYEAGTIPTGFRSLKAVIENLRELRHLRRHRMYTCDPFVGLGPAQWVFRSVGMPAPTFVSLSLSDRLDIDHAEARRMFGLAEDMHYLVNTGGISPRKGSGLLLEAMGRKNWPKNIGVLCTGQVHNSLNSLFNDTRNRFGHRLVYVDGFLSEREFSAAYLAADAVWAIKTTKGVSSNSIHAANVGRPSIVSSADRSAAWLQPRIGPGVRTAVNVGSIIRAVSTVMKCPNQTEKQRAFFEHISDPSSFTKILTKSF